MKKRYLIVLILLFSFLFVLSGCNNANKNTENSENKNNTEINRTSAEFNVSNPNKEIADNNTSNTNSGDNENVNTSNVNKSSNENITSSKEMEKKPVETELASFSTRIIDKDENRQNNIRLTCSKLNELTIDGGSTFSFLKSIGETTVEAGYKEADILINGKKTKGLGGGNCQVSSTLYNAALKSEGLEVTERHEHDKKVPYIEKGKDATIAFPSLDLKFKNNSQNQIKLYTSTDGNSVTVKIVKIS